MYDRTFKAVYFITSFEARVVRLMHKKTMINDVATI